MGGNDGSTREEWTENMRKFVDYFAYRHSDFDAYRRCVQDHVFNVAKDLTSDDIPQSILLKNLSRELFCFSIVPVKPNTHQLHFQDLALGSSRFNFAGPFTIFSPIQ